MPDLIRTELGKVDGEEDERAAKKLGKKFEWKLLFGDHHESHAAALSILLPLKKQHSNHRWRWRMGHELDRRRQGNEITLLKELHFQQPWSALQRLHVLHGFPCHSGEYKVMGLAPYGEPKYVSVIKDKLLEVRDDAV